MTMKSAKTNSSFVSPPTHSTFPLDLFGPCAAYTCWQTLLIVIIVVVIFHHAVPPSSHRQDPAPQRNKLHTDFVPNEWNQFLKKQTNKTKRISFRPDHSRSIKNRALHSNICWVLIRLVTDSRPFVSPITALWCFFFYVFFQLTEKLVILWLEWFPE